MGYFIIAICVLLLYCILRLYGAERTLRNVSQQLDERERTASRTKLSLQAPNAAAEQLLTSINQLLALREREASDHYQQEKLIRQQIANMSHDLRTPLTSILGYLQLLESERLTREERREYLEIVQGRAKNLQSLITSFYDLSRLEEGEYPLVRESVDLYRVLSRLCAEFYNDFTDRGVSVHVELTRQLPMISADPSAVLRIVSNLLRNAMEHGSGRLDIRLYRDGDMLISSFSNDTRNFTEDDVSHVFERFYTADQMRTGQNTGLGLAIVKGLVERMGHRVEATLVHDLFTVSIFWRLNAS